MPKLVPKRGIEKPTVIKSTIVFEKKPEIPALRISLGKDIPEVIGFSTAKRESGWVVIDRFSKTLEEQPTFDNYGTARAYADAMNEEVTSRRFK